MGYTCSLLGHLGNTKSCRSIYELFSPPMKNISIWKWEDYHWFLSGIPVNAITIIPKACSQNSPRISLCVEKLRPFGEDVLSQALKLYNSSAPCPINDRCPERLYTTLVSDIRASCPSNHLAKQAAGPYNPICLMTFKKTPFLMWFFS